MPAARFHAEARRTRQSGRVVMKTASRLALGAFSSLFVMVAASTPTPALAQDRALTKITFSLDFIPLGRHAPWYAAVAEGYYKAEGLDVSIIPSHGTAQTIQAIEFRHRANRLHRRTEPRPRPRQRRQAQDGGGQLRKGTLCHLQPRQRSQRHKGQARPTDLHILDHEIQAQFHLGRIEPAQAMASRVSDRQRSSRMSSFRNRSGPTG